MRENHDLRTKAQILKVVKRLVDVRNKGDRQVRKVAADVYERNQAHLMAAPPPPTQCGAWWNSWWILPSSRNKSIHTEFSSEGCNEKDLTKTETRPRTTDVSCNSAIPVLMFPSPPESTLFQRGAALFGLRERSNRLKEGAKRKLIASDTPGGPA